MSVFHEFQADRGQRVVVEGAPSTWIPIVSKLPLHGQHVGFLLLILNTFRMFNIVAIRSFNVEGFQNCNS